MIVVIGESNLKGNEFLMALYQLPCPKCDSFLEVSARHAGQTRDCENCHVAVDVPKLGQLRNLDPVEGHVEKRVNRAPSQARSWMFTGGLLLLSLFGLGGFALHLYAQTLYSNIGAVTEHYTQVTAESIPKVPPHELYEWWTKTAGVELGEWKEHPNVGKNVQHKILTNIAFGMYALAGIGLLCMLGSMLI